MSERMNNCQRDKETQGEREEVEESGERENGQLRERHRDSERVEGGQEKVDIIWFCLSFRSASTCPYLMAKQEISQGILVFIHFSCYDRLVILSVSKMKIVIKHGF